MLTITTTQTPIVVQLWASLYGRSQYMLILYNRQHIYRYITPVLHASEYKKPIN